MGMDPMDSMSIGVHTVATLQQLQKSHMDIARIGQHELLVFSSTSL